MTPGAHQTSPREARRDGAGITPVVRYHRFKPVKKHGNGSCGTETIRHMGIAHIYHFSIVLTIEPFWPFSMFRLSPVFRGANQTETLAYVMRFNCVLLCGTGLHFYMTLRWHAREGGGRYMCSIFERENTKKTGLFGIVRDCVVMYTQ